MEAFESFVALALETENLVVSEALKFDISRQTTSGLQTHGYEVDLVGARSDLLVLASVKSYFGSKGVHADEVAGTSSRAANNRRYILLNQAEIRTKVIELAAARFGYRLGQVELRLYVGKFAGRPGTHDVRVRKWCSEQRAGRGTIKVVGVEEVVARVQEVATKKQYRDNAALVALKVLDAAGALRPVSTDLSS